MKLELTNFRSFSKAVFRFSSDYTLVSGPSGAGKTSIFMAIQFAISGEGKKIVKNGKTKCSVVFETLQIKITRTKGPCRLCVVVDNMTYEDACAQAMIDKTLPNWELGYVSQRLYKSFILMTPSDKLALIEKMAFSGTDISAIQNRCKSLIAERKTTLEDAKKERSTIERVLTDIGCEEKSPTLHDNLPEQLYRFKSEKSLAVNRFNEAKRNWDHRKFLLLQLEELKQENTSMIVDLPCSLQELIKQRENFNRYMAIKRQLDEKTPHSGMSEQEIDTCIQDMNNLKMIQLKLVNLPKLRNELKQREEFKKTHAVCLGACPACLVSLSSWNGKLMASTDKVQNITTFESEACEQKLNKLLAEISALEDLEKEQEKIKSLYEDEQINAVEQLRYLVYVKNNDKLWENCAAAQCENPSDDIIKLAQEVELYKFNQKANKEKLAKITSSLLQLEPKLENVELLEQNIDKLSQIIQEIETEIKANETRRQWDAVRRLREVECEMEIKLPSAVRLSTLVKTAERLSLEEILGNINLRAGIYLQRILPSVTANLVFEAKNTTEKIELKLNIDNLPTDVNSLSGGEFARLVLAFAIAMAEMNNVDLLILDESFASLDSETTEIVLCAIKENYFGKVIVIAHQTTKGVFDEVIEL